MIEDKLVEIKKKVTKKNIYIRRIPMKSKVRFEELTNEDFDGDYGFCLKYLLDFHDGLLTSPNQHLLEEIELLKNQLNMLTEQKSVPEEPKKKVIKSLAGTKIAERRD